MRIKKKFLLFPCLVLVFSAILLCAYSRSECDEGVNMPAGRDISAPRAPYAETAALIGGINTPQSVLAPLENRPVWTEFARFADCSWEKYDKMYLSPMREWAAKEMDKSIPSGLTVFYPFSGPDFVSPFTLFPGADNYVFVALERVGRVPDFQGMNPEEFDSFFSGIHKSLHDLLSIDYFISSHMLAGMEGQELNGVLPFLLFFMAREKTRILDVEYWFIEPDGTVRKVSGMGSGAAGKKGAVPGVRILFESEKSPGNKPQSLYYFRLNLYNSNFSRNSHFVSFLKGFGPLVTFMKSAAYVMFDADASLARKFVLDQSRYILQEDSGIPFKYFDPSVWAFQFYGAYKGPLSTFNYAYQPRIADIYESGKDIKPLPFGIGYRFQVDTANLLFAKRKR